MGRKKMWQFSAPSSENTSIPLKNPEVVREQRKKRQNGQKGDKTFKGKGGMGVLHWQMGDQV